MGGGPETTSTVEINGFATRHLPDAAHARGRRSGGMGIEQARAAGAAARLSWPLGDTRLARRLPFTKAPTSLLWGGQDRPMPPSHARRFAEKLCGPNETRTMPGAAHLAGSDRPDEVARTVSDRLN